MSSEHFKAVSTFIIFSVT